jgi:hypothetical protein
MPFLTAAAPVETAPELLLTMLLPTLLLLLLPNRVVPAPVIP